VSIRNIGNKTITTTLNRKLTGETSRRNSKSVSSTVPSLSSECNEYFSYYVIKYTLMGKIVVE